VFVINQNFKKSGLCVFGFLSFFPFGAQMERHNAQRDSLQHWQKSQSGQECFFRCFFFSMSYCKGSEQEFTKRVRGFKDSSEMLMRQYGKLKKGGRLENFST
jgi:hypothetical protein